MGEVVIHKWDGCDNTTPFITTWKIIPNTRKWLITLDNKSPKDRVAGPLPNGLSVVQMEGGYQLYLLLYGG